MAFDWMEPSGFRYFDPNGFASVAPPQPDFGIVGNVLNSIIQDIRGGGRIIGATFGEAANLLGASVPLTYDDLTQRDLRGGMMLASLAAGGIAGGAVRSLPMVANVAAKGAVGRAAVMGGSELIAGAAFGVMRPLEEDESRLGAVFGDAAINAGIGVGASFMRSAVRATIGAKMAEMKNAAKNAEVARAAMAAESSVALQKYAGVELLNPTTGSRIGIRELADGRTSITRFAEKGAKTTEHVETFDVAALQANSEGFTQSLGFFNKDRIADSVKGRLDEATLDVLTKSGDDVSAFLKPLQLTELAAVRNAAKAATEAADEIDNLVAEAVVPADILGLPKLSDAQKRTIISELKLNAAQVRNMADGDYLREGLKRGIISVDGLRAGMDYDEFLRELFLNNTVKEGLDYTVNPLRDLVFGSILPGMRIAARHPEIAPLIRMADEALRLIDIQKTPRLHLVSALRQKYSADVINRAVTIIDSTGGIEDIAAARQEAIRLASASGDAGVLDVVTQTTTILDDYLQRASAVGILEEGRSGYFPIHNANKWKLDIQDWANGQKVDFNGFWTTKKAANAELERIRQLNPDVSGHISPRGFWRDSGGVGKAATDLSDKATSAYTTNFGQAPLKSTGFAKQRILGIRDFSKDPLDALEIYVNEMERAIGLRDFERASGPILEALGASQTNLKHWGEQFVADVMGRPRPIEAAFDAILEAAGIDAQPRALGRWTSAARKWQAFARLGGFSSAIVNTSQVFLNTQAKLGVRWTAKGAEVLLSPAKRRQAVHTLTENKVNFGHFISLSDEAAASVLGGPVEALKEKRYAEAVHRISLYLFNGAEKVNRLVTGWGAFNQALTPVERGGLGMTKAAAASYAEEIINTTQFNYRLSNMPELLRGPVGGLLFQFKSFIINELDFLASLSDKEMARFGAAAMSLGGAALFMNTPPGDLLNHASLLFTDEKLDEAMKLRAGDKLSQSLVYGLPGALLNVDLSDHVGIGTVADVTRNLFGPSVSDATKLTTFIKEAALDIGTSGFIREETHNRFVQDIAPSAIRRFTRGIDIFTSGEARNPYSGKLIYRPQDRLRAALTTAIGFPTLELQQNRAAEMVVTRASERYRSARGEFAKKAAQATLGGDSAEAQRVLRDAATNGYHIDGRTISYWMQELQRAGSERRGRRTPRALREELTARYEATGAIARR